MTSKGMAVGVVFAVLLLPVTVSAGAPMDTVKAGVDKVIAVTLDTGLSVEAKKEKIRGLVGEFFDFDVLSQLTLGRNWRDFKPPQQKQFVTLYRAILEDVYMDRILAYANEKVEYAKEIMHSDKKAEIETKVITKTTDIPISYRMVLRQDGWRVYDVVIEGVSLVKNYRSQFEEMLAKQKPEELIETLQKKVDKK